MLSRKVNRKSFVIVKNHLTVKRLILYQESGQFYTDGDGVRLGNERLSVNSERSPRL